MVELLASSAIFAKSVGQMMCIVQSPILQQFSTLIMSLQNCNFKRIEFLSIHGLSHANLQQILDYLNIAISCSIVQQGIIGIISSVVSGGGLEQIEKTVILIISDGDHHGCSSEMVVLWVVLFICK